MSQNIDDSPNSDNNVMDISEQTTLSQESFGLSPETEQRMSSIVSKTTTSTRTVTAAQHHPVATTINTSSNLTSRTSNQNSNSNSNSNTNRHDNKFDDSSLDNRILVNKNTITTNSKHRIGMTLVDMHPLMIDGGGGAGADDVYDDDLTPESEFINTESESPMHVSPQMQRINTLGVPKAKQFQNEKSAFISSGESEPDISQYQALVEPTFQTATLTNYSADKLANNIGAPKVSGLRKIPLTAELMVTNKEDDSSIETISNNSFDDDFVGDVNPDAVAMATTVADDDDDDDDDFDENGDAEVDDDDEDDDETKSNRQQASNPKMVLTRSVSAMIANESGGKVQHVQGVAVTLPNGQTRDIDMKVIEPYKRCLSHGGYIKSPGHNAIVVFSACYLPDRSRADYHYVMENLFLYVIKTLEQFVTDDYILIYLHGGSNRNTVPPLPWLKKCYHLLDRRIRKSLKNLYMVHPTFWLKSVVWMARPFISSKFWRKLVYIRTLDDLYQIIPVEKAAVPEKVKIYDRKHS